jgi:hypothetical protein
MAQKPTIYRADYYYKHTGSRSSTRTQITGSVSQHLNGATTENAVVAYLRRKHPGHGILLMSLEWK